MTDIRPDVGKGKDDPVQKEDDSEQVRNSGKEDNVDEGNKDQGHEPERQHGTDEQATEEHTARPPWMPERPVVPPASTNNEDELEAEAMFSEQQLVHESPGRNNESNNEESLPYGDYAEQSASSDPGANYWTCWFCSKKNIPLQTEVCPNCPATKTDECETYEERQDSDEDGSSEQYTQEQDADEDALDEQAANDQQLDNRTPHEQGPAEPQSGEHQSGEQAPDEQEEDEPRVKRARLE